MENERMLKLSAEKELTELEEEFRSLQCHAFEAAERAKGFKDVSTICLANARRILPELLSIIELLGWKEGGGWL